MASPSSKQRTADEMLHSMSPCGDKIIVSATGAAWSGDYTVPDNIKIKGIIVADGDVPLKCDFKNSDGTTVTGYIEVPNWSPMDGLQKIYFAGSNSTMIMLIKE